MEIKKWVNAIVRIVLSPFALLFLIITGIRNILFNIGLLKSTSFKVPVICVGNITVGGTGKTPHVEYLVNLLKTEYKLAVLSRGYKRKTDGFILANENSTAEDIGDEPLQIKSKFPDVHVAVEKRRVKGINKLLELKSSLNAIILDDAFQHRYVKPGLSILLIDYNKPITKDFILPMGRLRESACQRKRAHIVIFTKCPREMDAINKQIFEKDHTLFPYQNIYFTTLKYAPPIAVFPENTKNSIDFSDFKKKKPAILMVTGIANPHLFKKHLDTISPQITKQIFSDHHAFTNKDIEKIKMAFECINNTEKIILTTEKDAMRLKHFIKMSDVLKNNFYYIPMEIEFLFNGGKEFDDQVVEFCKK